jgi:hypothetical protein
VIAIAASIALPSDSQLGVEGLGLRRRARKAVKDEALVACPAPKARRHEPDDDGVGHELAGVHVALRLEPERRPFFTAARRMSPVEMCGTPYSSMILAA